MTTGDDEMPLVSESLLERLSLTYADIKRTLGVPWVAVLFQALAAYPEYLLRAWSLLRPSLDTRIFREACEVSRKRAGELALALRPGDHASMLRARGTNEAVLETMRRTIDVFNRGNHPYLIIATALRESFSGRPVGQERALEDAGATRIAPRPTQATLPMIEERDADPDLRALYGRIKTALRLPFVNSDYKAMAVYPPWLEVAWSDLSAHLDTPAYIEARTAIAQETVSAARRLSFPFTCTREGARIAGVPERELDALSATLNVFADLLPGLVINVSYFRQGLEKETWPWEH